MVTKNRVVANFFPTGRCWCLFLFPRGNDYCSMCCQYVLCTRYLLYDRPMTSRLSSQCYKNGKSSTIFKKDVCAITSEPETNIFQTYFRLLHLKNHEINLQTQNLRGLTRFIQNFFSLFRYVCSIALRQCGALAILYEPKFYGFELYYTRHITSTSC